ncbi:hypothetical protein D9757_009977 [Collybiopsis confluens]|uniref:Uncharacterized protein n=1 Tax=Collybiopsis confluens TaxID=2823264 RepID=A0A8H5LW29_9AGAR|nr:hypothetical protein D9757_009977 [Collybiopsis confluens]
MLIGAYICTVIYLKKESVVLFTDPFTVVETRLLLHMDYGIAISELICIVAIVVNNLALTTLIIYRVRKLTQVTNQFLPVSEQVHGGRLVKTIVGSYLLYGIGIIALRVGIIAGPIVDVFKLAPIPALVIGISSTFLIVEVDLDSVGHPLEHVAQDSPDVGGDAIESVQQSLSRDIV